MKSIYRVFAPALLVLCIGAPASAEPPGSAGRFIRMAHLGDDGWVEAEPAVTPQRGSSLSVGFAFMTGEQRQVVGGDVRFILPFELVASRLAQPSYLPSLSLSRSAAVSSGGETAARGSSAPPSMVRASPRSLGSPLPLIRPRDARAAVRAALSRGSWQGAARMLGGLSSRVRYSSLLPELELRVRRLLDASARLSPTSYDAHRLIESDSARLWLEARTSWSLDRLLFAKPELSIIRLQQALDTKRARQARAVLDLLFAWQAAWFESSDPTNDYAHCRRAWLRVQQLAARLDLATHRWFSTWRADAPALDNDCAQRLIDR